MLTFDDVKEYCLSKPGAIETYPFDEKTLVIKIRGKMFALMGMDAVPTGINLKCDPQEAEALRSIYPGVKPGYHMNKRHWNTVILDGNIPDEEILGMIDHSYELVSGSKK